MVSKGPAANPAAGKENTWNFQFKNRNLRVVPASRTSTLSEHSTSYFESKFRSLLWTKTRSERESVNSW
jgi:hypothetical protein